MMRSVGCVARADKVKGKQSVTNGDSVGLPGWALDLLARPVSDAHQEIVDLSGLTPDEREAAARRFPLARYCEDAEVWVLNSTQARFRQLLSAFAREIPGNTTVVDFASAEADFVAYFQHCRYLAMDFSAAKLHRAIELGRVSFAVVADVTKSPLRECATDVIVSTNTLMHLEHMLRGPAAGSLGRALRPGGLLATTVLTSDVDAILAHLGGGFSVVEQCGLRGPLSRHVGERLARVLRRVTQSRQPSIAGRQLIRAGNAAARAIARAERLALSAESERWAMQWLVVRKSA